MPAEPSPTATLPKQMDVLLCLPDNQGRLSLANTAVSKRSGQRTASSKVVTMQRDRRSINRGQCITFRDGHYTLLVTANWLSLTGKSLTKTRAVIG